MKEQVVRYSSSQFIMAGGHRITPSWFGSFNHDGSSGRKVESRGVDGDGAEKKSLSRLFVATWKESKKTQAEDGYLQFTQPPVLKSTKIVTKY